jgi:hypothetical protein
VMSSSAADCCANKCGAYSGSFWSLTAPNFDAFVKGLAAMGWLAL